MDTAKLGAIVGAVVLAFTVEGGVERAFADTVYTINDNGGGTLSCCTGPYASVDVALVNSTTATVTFSSLTNGGFTYLLGSTGAADVNVNATSWTLSALAGTALSGFTNGTLSDGGAGTVDGFGAFNQTITNSDGFTNSHNQISFTLTDNTGTWTSSANVLAPNTNNFFVAIHGFACATPCTASEGATATGFATASAVPEGSTILLLGAGLVGIGFGIGLWEVRRRKEACV